MADLKKLTDEDLTGKRDEKDATIKLHLKAKSGYVCKSEGKISANQWNLITKILEGNLDSLYVLTGSYWNGINAYNNEVLGVYSNGETANIHRDEMDTEYERKEGNSFTVETIEFDIKF